MLMLLPFAALGPPLADEPAPSAAPPAPLQVTISDSVSSQGHRCASQWQCTSDAFTCWQLHLQGYLSGVVAELGGNKAAWGE